jgi:probable addiction module antidote protein
VALSIFIIGRVLPLEVAGNPAHDCSFWATIADENPTSGELMTTGKITRPASARFHAARHLKSDTEIAAYIDEMLSEGDPGAMPIALRTVADAAGGVAALAEKTGLSRETLYRTLSKKGNPRLDTLTAILAAYGLRLSVRTCRIGTRSPARA